MRGLKSARLKQYDYGNDGYYFVTVVAYARLNNFLTREKEVELELKDLENKTEGLNWQTTSIIT